MITKVKYLSLELARFNPEARLKYELLISGCPACECIVTTDGHDQEILDVLEENEDLDDRNEELLLALQKINTVLKSRMITEAQTAFDEINAIIEESEAV